MFALGHMWSIRLEEIVVMSINRDYTEFLATFHSDKFYKLWDAQDYILRNYASTFSPDLNSSGNIKAPSSDVAVELPTGAGKTLIALLIAEAWRQERKKVAILSANKTLARQMMQESQALKVPAVLMEGKSTDILASAKRAYQRATSVAIMNYWVYFNQNPVVDPADLIIMDDAHLAELCLHSLYSVEIDKFQHKTLFEELISEMLSRFPDYAVLTDALSKDAKFRSPTQLLSFIDQIEVVDRFRELVDTSQYLKQDQDLAFRWERIRGKIQEANIYISTTSIWIRPYIYPLLSNNHYKKAQQRLYFSATIGDPSDLSRRLGTKIIHKIPVPSRFMEKTSGRRLVIMNKMDFEEFTEQLYNYLFEALMIQPKSVWLCASNLEARQFKDFISDWLEQQGFTHETWLLTPQGDEIEKFKKATQGHLFVAGRFDGMDFNADECRIVVVPTLPRAINSQEDFISEHLRDASFMRKRLNQRIVQALGRCNRSDDDFALYLLLDRRFAGYFSNESSREGLPKNIIAEIDMAQDLADSEGKNVITELDAFLNGDFKQYDIELEGYIANIPENALDASEPDTSEDEIVAWNALFASQNYGVAAERFKKCWDIALKANLMEITAFHGWHWAKSLYLQSLLGEPSAREKSLSILESAIERGGQCAWFNRLRASLNRAKHSSLSLSSEVSQDDYADKVIRRFDDFLEGLGIREHKFERWCDELSSLLESSNHKLYQKGLEKLGYLLGYDAKIPDYQGATDCLWRGVFGNSREIFTFEAKIEQTSSQLIAYSDIGQVNNQIIRAKKEYPGYTVRSTVVTHLTVMAPEAEASAENIKVIGKEAVLDLWRRLKIILSLYRQGWSLYDVNARRVSSQTIRTRLPKTGWFIRVLDMTDDRFIDTQYLCGEWS